MAARTSKIELVTIKTAAEILGVSEATLRRWDKAGKLLAQRHPINGYRLYRHDQILDLKRRILSHAAGATR